LQEAARVVKGLPKRPNPAELDEMAAPWRPWRSVAAHLLWRYYRDVVKCGRTDKVVGFQ
jgi:DNA-3-methyladenine glycosylase II